MEPRRGTRRELAVLATTLVVLSRPLEGDLVWLVGVLVLATVILGGLQALDAGEPRGVALESVVTPAVAAAAAVLAIRLVPVGLLLLPAVVLVYLLIERALIAEAQLLARPTVLAPEDRNMLTAVALVSAFLAFAGIAGVIPGALVEPAGATPAGGAPAGLTEVGLLILVGADALVAALLGFRLALLESPSVRDAAWAALTYAAVIAIGAAAFRAIALPRLVGPALLTLLFYLWSAYMRHPRRLREDRRRLAEAGVLAVLGLAVIAWNLLLRR
jgi:hypothetical protein